MIVHQVLSGAGPVDAVTTQAVLWRARFDAWGWGGRDVAVHIDPRMDGAVRPLKDLKPGRGDVLLVHYSAYAPKLRALLDLPNPTLLLSHNVTPAKWLWNHDPQTAIQCALGRRQLPEFAARADLVAGVSAYNAAELGSDLVVPILFDPSRLGPPPERREPPEGVPTVLCVGRLAPHKRQDEVIRVLALLRAHRWPSCRFVLVGEPLNPAYGRRLHDLADQLGAGVEFRSGLSVEELAAEYAAAHAFLSLSEHEGFCVPLLEAFHMGVPVVARPSGGVPEVAGDAALLTDERDPAVLAELVALAATDPELRSTLCQRGRARLERFAPDVTAQAMRAALERLS